MSLVTFGVRLMSFFKYHQSVRDSNLSVTFGVLSKDDQRFFGVLVGYFAHT